MKYGILLALAEGRHKDALLMLEKCKVTKEVETTHAYIATALSDGDEAVCCKLGRKAMELMQYMDFEKFERA